MSGSHCSASLTTVSSDSRSFNERAAVSLGTGLIFEWRREKVVATDRFHEGGGIKSHHRRSCPFLLRDYDAAITE